MRTTFNRLVLLVVLQSTLPCYGWQVYFSHGPAVQSQAPRRTVTGTVVNAASGVPIRHALVQVSGISPATVLTGSDGRFEIDDVPEGPITVSAQKPGFFDAGSMPGHVWTQADFLTVGPGGNDFRVPLYPAAKIIGRVTDADGEAAENVSVQVLSEQIIQGRKMLQPQNNATTDDDGSYRIDGLMPGRYKVFANGHLLPAPSWNAPPEVSAPAYFPDSRDLVAAQQIELRAGQESRADFHLHSEPGFRITGTLGGIPDKANVGFSFENASGQNVMFGAMTIDQSKGQFVAQAVPSGIWTLVFFANDGRTNNYELRQEVAVDGADVTDLQGVLHPLASIPVTVHHAANAVQPSPDPGFADNALNAALISVEPFQYRTYGKQAQGSPPVLSFSNIAAGKYKLEVQPFGSECVESAWYGSTDLTRDYLVVGSGGETQALTINLRADCATLSIKLLPGEQPRTGFVLVVPSSPVAEPKLLQVASGSNASLTLSPGSYQVFAFSNIDGLEYANPEALRGYPSQTANLDPGQKAELTVELSERKGN